VLNHPDGVAMDIIAYDLSVDIPCDGKEPFAGFEPIDLDAEDILLYGITGCLWQEFAILVPEDVNFLVAASCDDKVLEVVERAEVPGMTAVIFGEFVH
jgi:hypothetical protein